MHREAFFLSKYNVFWAITSFIYTHHTHMHACAQAYIHTHIHTNIIKIKKQGGGHNLKLSSKWDIPLKK